MRLKIVLPVLLLTCSKLACSQAQMKFDIKQQEPSTCVKMVKAALACTLDLPIQITQQVLTTSVQFTNIIGKAITAILPRSSSSRVRSLDQQITQVFQEAGTHRQLPASKRQIEIASSLCSNTELPYELIRLIIVYDDPFLFHQPSHAITALIVLTPSHHLASSSKDSSVRIWDHCTGECLKKLPHELPITAITPLSNNKLATSQTDNTIHIWNTITGTQQVTCTGKNHQNESISSLLVLPNEKLISGGSFDAKSRNCCFNCTNTCGIIKIWNTKTGTLLQSFPFDNPIRGLWPSLESVNTIVITTDPCWETSDVYEITNLYTKILYFDTATGQYTKPMIYFPKTATHYLSLSPSTHIAAGDSKNIYKYNAEKNSYQTYSPFLLPSLSSFPIYLTLLSNKKIASAGWSDQKMRILNPHTLNCEQEFKMDNQVTALTALPKNKIAVGSANGKIEIIDATPEKDGLS